LLDIRAGADKPANVAELVSAYGVESRHARRYQFAVAGDVIEGFSSGGCLYTSISAIDCEDRPCHK